jgi:uncharacterized 2Fe-2S/4Fe-4S cluster protein (DUF4445 family)
MPKVTFQPAGAAVDVNPGTSLLDAARQADVPIRNDCGGQGVCGRCVVEVRRGRADRLKSRHQLPPERCLACRTLVAGQDLEVFLPPESCEAERDVTVREVAPFPREYPPSGALVEAVPVELDRPSLDDNVADAERLVRSLQKGKPGDYRLPLAVLRDLPVRLRDAEWRPTVTLSAEAGGPRVLDARPRNGRPCCLAAVDVGTTTVKAALLAPGARWTASCYNSQAVFGPDVISRIMHCQRDTKGGAAALQERVVQDINRLTAALADAAGLTADDVWGMVVSGNTTMLHLLLGLQPAWIRRDPYVGCAYRVPPVRPADVGVRMNARGRVFCLPSVSSFVGADISAGVLATGMADGDRPAALIDLGTNGEITIGCREFLVCCSASAGPAFEGAGSASGTRARDGAVESVWSDGGVRWRTIGGEAPCGICGTGYIDLLATLVREGIMDKTGRLVPGAAGVREDDGEFEYVLVAGAEARGRDVILTRADAENLIRAKGAIYAAGSVLLGSLGMDWKDLDRIMLAGGFGESLDKENAVAIGLLPDVARERIDFVGNTSLRGAVMAAASAADYARLAGIARRMTYFELSTHPDFMEEFVSACFLPHTDAEKFPSVAAVGR